MSRMIATIYAATIIGGFLSFFLAGGIPKLASDVSTSGAWGLSVFIQLLYATLITAGFTIYILLRRKVTVLGPTHLSVATTSLLISASINLYGVFRTGPGIDAIWGSAIVIGCSAVLFFIVDLIRKDLTRQSNATP
jgi:hypothetical protein